MLACGALWTVTYIGLIINTHTTRLTGMPYFALMLNITWEATFSFITPHPWPQRAIDILWLALDTIILIQTLTLYPFHQPPLRLSRPTFLSASAATLASTLALNWTWSVTLDGLGAYSGFVMNLYMSIAFVVLFYTRVPRGAGQSIVVAVCKMAGTGVISVAFYSMDSSDALLDAMYVAVFVWDAVYVALLVGHRLQQRKEEQVQLHEEQQQQQYATPWLLHSNAGDVGMRVSHASLAGPSFASY